MISQIQSAAKLPNFIVPFEGAHHEWTMLRAGRPFVVRAVEPDCYAPEDHSNIFNSVVSHLVSPAQIEVSSTDDVTVGSDPVPFDLVTFPEAFVPASTLVDALTAFASTRSPTGCIHVGLRPDGEKDRHLFTTAEVRTLIAEIIPTAPRVAADVAAFEAWADRQPSGGHFNIGCLFAVDAEGELRVCLHPKIVRSQFETNPLPERHMDEGALLTVVTLLPSDKNYPSVTVQPMICSDALDLSRDKPGGPPLEAVNTFAGCLSDHPPDHIDVVSVATCTPQREVREEGHEPYRIWHEKFRDTFKAVGQSAALSRHHFAAIVLSNFRTVPGKAPGGLSGIFMPVAPRYASFHPSVHVSCFGRKGKGDPDNRWSQPATCVPEDWNVRGFVAGLAPFSEPVGTPARIFGFTVQRLPRDNGGWGSTESLTACDVLAAERSVGPTMKFAKDGAHV